MRSRGFRGELRSFPSGKQYMRRILEAARVGNVAASVWVRRGFAANPKRQGKWQLAPRLS